MSEDYNTMWLPPLNSGNYESKISVEISQNVAGSKKRSINGPMFIVKFEETVDFESSNGELENFLGLSVEREIQIPFDDVSTERVGSEIRNHSSLKLTDRDITFRQGVLGESNQKSHRFSEVEEFYEKVVNFLCMTTEKAENAGANTIQIELSILKDITVPQSEFQTWHDWYDEKSRNDSFFEQEYMMAVERPRTQEEEARAGRNYAGRVEEEEKLELEEVEFGDLSADQKICCICFDDFSPNSELRKLGCDHVFDHQCIEKWLQYSNMCPLCRFNE